MSILVTGAAGFLGRHLVAHLEKTTSEPITAVIRNPEKKWKSPAKKVVVELSDGTLVKKLIESTRPKFIYHLAGHSRVSSALGMPEYFGSNYLTTARLLESLETLDHPVKLFLASTIHVYGNIEGVATEATRPQPVNDYGFSKYITEELLKDSCNRNQRLSALVGRLYSCFGPGQSLGFVSADLCHKIGALPKNGIGKLEVGPISTFRSFLDVRDAVKLLPLLLNQESPEQFRIVNIASPYQVQIKDLISILLGIANKKAHIESNEDNSGNRLFGIRVSCDKLKSMIADVHFRKVEETLRDMYEGRA